MFRTYPLTSYFFITFIIAWAVWLPMIIWHLSSMLIYLGAVAPIGSGILMT